VNTPDLETAPLSYPKHKIRVLLLEGIHESARSMFENDGVHVQLLPSALEEKELMEAIRDVHLLGIRSKTQVTPAVIESARRLLSVGCFCIGTNQVDLDACNVRGIPVFNAPFSNTRSVAELIISEVVALSRQLGDRNREMHEGNWQKSAKGSREVRGKTLGIVGYGRIGRQVGVLAESMGMQVVFFDVVSQLPMGNNRSLGSLDALLALQADMDPMERKRRAVKRAGGLLDLLDALKLATLDGEISTGTLSRLKSAVREHREATDDP